MCGFSIILIFKENYDALTQFRMGRGGKKDPLQVFLSPVTSTNVEINP